MSIFAIENWSAAWVTMDASNKNNKELIFFIGIVIYVLLIITLKVLRL